MTNPRRGDVFLVSLDPVRGSEIAKTRPCLIVSPDVLNDRFSTVIVAPLTSTEKPYPTRCRVEVKGRPGYVALDQIRTISRERLIKRVAAVDPSIALEILREIFAD
ncbi:MAG: type II toxin-antitoxin system PemK/MazF family toxin [Rhodocyclaceae bacterium]|nr:type II toxin-antitoxin system PemK/MazF family toxin [Rhodocyclaceae bacterium]